jgi:beta-N-acetylhexosaminidase
MTHDPRFALDDTTLSAAPFNLTAEALDWVKTTFSTMTVSEKLCQIILPMCRDLSPEKVAQLAAKGPGGIHRFPSFDEHDLRASAEIAQAAAKIPFLMTADIEFSEKGSVKSGTAFPNQMAVAATGDPENARKMGALAAREAGYLGFCASWTPVGDLALNHRSNVVNTRAFSDDTDTTIAFCTAYIEGARAEGFASCLKHFPGDGLDDRDQHFVTTHNTMGMSDWRASFGRIYRAGVDAQVPVIMAGHITLPAYTAELAADARCPAGIPAALNADLLLGLLRKETGYNGVIVSDATGMVGFSSLGRRDRLVPMCIENGCDILLFPNDFDEDLGYLTDGLDSGLLSQQRVDEAVLRILALKASLGLHKTRGALPDSALRHERLGGELHAGWSRKVAQDCLTLVKDDIALLPLSPERHRRVLIAEKTGRRSPSGPLPDLKIAEMLEMKGFSVTRLIPGAPVPTEGFDVALYLSAEEGVSAKEDLGPQWERLHGSFPFSMERLWDYYPTVYVSLGTPFLLYHMPQCPTYLNAYSAVLPVQQALVDALTGDAPILGTSPCNVAQFGFPEIA